MFLFSTFLLYSSFKELKEGNEKIDSRLNEFVKLNEQLKLDTIDSNFNPEYGETIGILVIPKINEKLPIVEGTDFEMLKQGVGHYETTLYPGQGGQLLLSGHRNTVFTRLKELDVGDKFIVQMSYGTYEYELKSTEIVNQYDTTIIRDMDEETLTLSTCYPFSYLGNAPDRYIVYAILIDEY